MDTTSTSSKTPKFLRALYTILHTEPQDILAWSPCGAHFQVYDVNRLETQVLPRYFKHNKFASFQRQLNNFGFRKWTKTRASVCTFSHDSLVQCHPSELHTMMQTATKAAPPSPQSACAGRKRPRSQTEESPETPKKTKTDVSIDIETDSADVWSLDWSVFYGDDVHCLVDEDAVGLPLELLFVDEMETDVLEPLALTEDISLAVSDWCLLADCLA